MNFRELNEDVHIDNFATGARETLKDLGGLAKNALGKFKTAKKEIKDENKKSAKKAQKELSKAAKVKAKEADAAAGHIKTPTDAEITVAGILLDGTPHEDNLPMLDNATPEELVLVRAAAETVEKRLDKFTSALEKNFRQAPFIRSSDRASIGDRLSDSGTEKFQDGAEHFLDANRFGERDAWMKALSDDNPKDGIKAMTKLLGKISKVQDTKNDAQWQTYHLSGMNLINVIGAWILILHRRIEHLKTSLEELSKRPVMSEALLKRVGKFARKL